MPIGKYRNFDACVRANLKKRNPQAYCAAIENTIKERRKVKKLKKKK